jgi:cytochrome c-type protein NapB
MSRSRIIITAFMIAVIMVISPGNSYSQAPEGVTEEELGIRKKSLYSEDEVQPAKGVYPDASPGKSKRFARAFENSPPLIPHDLTGMLPIAETNNMCMGCHMPMSAKSVGAVAIPRSHLIDMDTGKDLGGELDGERFNCMQCHVPQVKMPPAVKNLFEGEFRDEKGKYSSNLADILNEGIE